MSFYKVDITHGMKCSAQKSSIEYRNAAEERNGTPIFQTENDLYDKIVGRIGEEIFNNILYDNNIKYTWTNIEENGRHDWDFEISKKKLDIKTGQMSWSIDDMKPGYKFLIVKQQDRSSVDYFVNVQINLTMTEGYIMGYISKEDAFKYPVIKTDKMYSPSYGVPIGELRNIKYLFNELGYSLNKYVKYGKEQDVQVSLFDY